MFSPIEWDDGKLKLLDQTCLPHEEVWLTCATPKQVADAIYRLAVRGAPAIGVSAAYGLVLGVQTLEGADSRSVADFASAFEQMADALEQTRPTAVNLRWAIEQGRALCAKTIDKGPRAVRDALLQLAHRIKQEDVAANRRMGQFGADLFEDGQRALTHCNAGALATAGYGTALGVIRAAWEAGKSIQVWVDETRPLLQGARLTTWELARVGIPFQLITDNSAGALMSRGLVDKVVVGADRIAANGDVANKIGTYTVAVLAQRHGVPFYVAAPLSTIDPHTATGADIPIEERSPDEVTRVLDTQVAPIDTRALNLAFDVTPNELIGAIITEAGVLRAPYSEAIADAFQRTQR